MVRFLTIVGLAVAGSSGLAAQSPRGDALRGEQLVRDRGCVNCHKAQWSGGNTTARIWPHGGRATFTPAALAGVAVEPPSRRVERQPAPSRKATSRDQVPRRGRPVSLLRFQTVFSIRGATPSGAGRFYGRKCSTCHGNYRAHCQGCSCPFATWRSLRARSGCTGPVELQSGDGPRVREEGVHYPRLTSGEMNDLAHLSDNLVRDSLKEPKSSLPAATRAAAEFQSLQWRDLP